MIPDYNATFTPVFGSKEEVLVQSRVLPPGEGYPMLYLQARYKVNPRTHMVNPATVKADVRVRVRPYSYDPTGADFNAPYDSLKLEVKSELVIFLFIYILTIVGSGVKVAGGIQRLIGANAYKY